MQLLRFPAIVLHENLYFNGGLLKSEESTMRKQFLVIWGTAKGQLACKLMLEILENFQDSVAAYLQIYYL